MNLFSYSITKRPYVSEELREALENEINCRLLLTTGSTTEETLKAFKQWYTFYKIVKLIENNNLQLSKDLAEENKRLSLNHFYNTMKAVEAIDHIGQADLRSLGGVTARVVKDPQLGFDDIEFTKKC